MSNLYNQCPSFESPKLSESFTDYNSNGTWDDGEPWDDENEDEVKGNEADMDLEDMPSFDPNNTLKIKTALESAVQKNGKVHETVLEEGQVTTVLEQEENENDNNNWLDDISFGICIWIFNRRARFQHTKRYL